MFSYGQPVSCGEQNLTRTTFEPPVIDLPSGERGPLQAIGLYSYNAEFDVGTQEVTIRLGLSMVSCLKDKTLGKAYFYKEPADPADYLLLVVYRGLFSDVRFRQNFSSINTVDMESGDVKTSNLAILQIKTTDLLSSSDLSKLKNADTVNLKMSAHYAFRNYESPVRAYFQSQTYYDEDLKGAHLYGASHGLSLSLQKDRGVVSFQKN